MVKDDAKESERKQEVKDDAKEDKRKEEAKDEDKEDKRKEEAKDEDKEDKRKEEAKDDAKQTKRKEDEKDEIRQTRRKEDDAKEKVENKQEDAKDSAKRTKEDKESPWQKERKEAAARRKEAKLAEAEARKEYLAKEAKVKERDAREQARRAEKDAAQPDETKREAAAETASEAEKTKSLQDMKTYKFDPAKETYDKTTEQISAMRVEDRGGYNEGKAVRDQYPEPRYFHCGEAHGKTHNHNDFIDTAETVAISMKTVMRPELRSSEMRMRNEITKLAGLKIPYEYVDGSSVVLKQSLDIRVPKDQVVGAYGRLRALKDFGNQNGVKVRVFGY
jgi:hypothetical protein